MSDREMYEGHVAETVTLAYYPAVRVRVDENYPDHLWKECANGHAWGSRTADECRTCRKLHNHRVAGRPECVHEGCRKVVTCSDRAFEAGVRMCEEHFREERSSSWHSGLICLDEFVTVMGQYHENTWNGWLMPSIDPHGVQAVIDAFGLDDTTYTYEWLEIEDSWVLRVTDHQDEDEEYVEDLYPDEDGLYSLGAGSWTWSEDSFTCGVLVDDFPCRRYPNHEGAHNPVENDPDDEARQKARQSVSIAANNAENQRLHAEGTEMHVMERIEHNHAAGAAALAEYDRVHGTPPWAAEDER